MSNRRFIEITSANRNRNQYPQPAQFEVPFAPPRSLNTNQSIRGAYSSSTSPLNIIYSQNVDVADLVTSGIVEYQWYGSNQLYDRGVITGGIVPAGSTYTLSVSGLSNSYTFPASFSIVLNNRIIACTINSSTSITITTTPALTLSVGLSFQILTRFTSPSIYYDTSTLQTGTTSTISKFYVNVNSLISPYKNIINFYVGYQLVLATNGVAGIINSYNPTTGLFTVEIPLLTSITNPTDIIYIVDPSSASNLSSPNTIILPAIDSTGKTILGYDQSYNGYYLIDETQSSLSLVYSKIVSFDFTLNRITLENPLTNWQITDKYTIRKTLPTQFFITANTPTGLPPLTTVNGYNQINISNSLFLPPSLTQADNYYNGQYIYIYPNQVINNQITTLQNIEGSCFYIQSYIGAPYNACILGDVLTPNLRQPSQYYPSYENTTPTRPLPGTLINIVYISNDNYNPLMYNGSTVSQNETVAYEISLVNLTLPNITLVTGSRSSFYPYLYVEISNATASSSASKNIIYSNNPNSTDALFIVPITDINDPIRSPFIKLDGGSMTQTVKFKPNDCLRFSVYLPNGQLYQPIMSDYYSPSGPNIYMQIDALFGIRRLTGV